MWYEQYFHNYECGEFPSYLTCEQASSKAHFQPVQSSFLHYDLLFYSIEKELNFARRKASRGLQAPFSIKLVFYRNEKEQKCASGNPVLPPKNGSRVTLISMSNRCDLRVRTHK
jgi:hypothetical protein